MRNLLVLVFSGLFLTLIAMAQAPSKSAAGVSSFAKISAQADAARDANRLDAAVPLYKKALALRPNWAEGWWSLGTISYDRNSYSEAARAFRRVIALAPTNGTAYVMLGLSEFELGQDELAFKHLVKGANLGLDKSSELRHVALYHQGVLLQRQGKFQAAQETLEQLCLEGLRSAELYTALGLTMLRKRDKATPTAAPDGEIIGRVGQAECLVGQKKFDEGRSGLTALVNQYPKYPGIHYALGLLLVEASDLPAAVAEFKQEIDNNPADVVSRLQIAAATYKVDSAAGLPYAEEAVKLDPQQPFAHFLLGLLRLDTGDHLKAIPELEIAEKAFPSEARIYLALATAYSRAGRKQDAVRARATFQHLSEQVKAASTGEQSPPESGDTRLPVGDAPHLPD